MTASIRAALPVQSLRVIEQLTGEPGLVFERMRQETLARIRATTQLDWLPLEVDLEISRAAAEVLGLDMGRRRARQCLRACLELPLLRPFVLGGELLLGREPSALLVTVPRGWNAVYRNAGRMRYEVGAGCCRTLVYEDIPSSLFADPVTAVDEDRRRATLECRWN